MRITKSKIGTYKDCPLMFKFQYIDKLKPEIQKPDVTQKGIDIHMIFYNFFDHVNLNEVPEEPIDYFYNSMSVDEKYKNIFKRFCKNEEILYRLKQRPIYLEKEFAFENFYGIVDRINFDGENYSLIDYKSSIYDKEELRFELYFYKYLIDSTNILSKPIKYIGIYGYNDGKLLFEPTTTIDFNLMLEKVIAFQSLKFNDIEYLARPAYHCKWCEYPKSCEDNKLQIKLRWFQ